MWLSEATFGSGKEAGFGGIVAAAGTSISAFLGGWDTALKLLVFLMVADYVSGLLGAIKNKNVNSEVMFWGGVRKGIVLRVVALASMCDQFVGGDSPIFRTITLYFYAGREGLSVVENLGIFGVPLPTGLAKYLERLHQKGQGEDKK
ncbi:toxin secretion/phage lysis holin [Paenibacillus tianmuensis]|uniref:Toxin secretion/phage lysis holin n=1 Tax=Paenibacillus tianmuensis TaxID=624147 RepID=A0A1G4RJW6_9BACL|nr:phage holin family protein [Paenibacillus tianmuensis]SCW57110.1 toxin secretion/phage lysis holin [Paenibacillus tianmuensis]